MKPNTNYTNLGGAALFSTGNAAIPLFTSFVGAGPRAKDKVWTGLQVGSRDRFLAAGMWLTGETCSDWQDENTGRGRFGENMISNSGNDYWFVSFMTDACTIRNSLYCVEQ